MNISIMMKGWAIVVTSRNYIHFKPQLIGVTHAKDVRCSSNSSHLKLTSFNVSFYEYFT